MIVKLKIADRIIEVEAQTDLVAEFSGNYLLPDSIPCHPDIRIKASPNELMNTYEHLYPSEEAMAANDLPIRNLEPITVFRKIADEMLNYDTLLIHGSAVATEGHGYLLTAASGVGKTTRSRLWVDNIPDSIIVNGDKPLIHITEDSVIIYGTPWCGKEHWNSNIAVPLRTIFLLERAAEGEADLVEEIGSAQAILGLGPQTHEPPGQNSLLRVMQLLRIMVNNVKCYRLRCAPTAEAVRMAWETARPKE